MDWIYEKLGKATVGIAGLGGLGSTVAAAMTRTGVGRLVVVDFDVVEESNLNRQQYFADQIGKAKVEATTENLRRINPTVKVEGFIERLTPENIPRIFADADVIAECFDKAEEKQMLVETVLAKMNGVVVVSASGLAGYGDSNAIRTRRISRRFVLVGDDRTAPGPGQVLTAGRVWIAAAHQANAIVEIIANGTGD